MIRGGVALATDTRVPGRARRTRGSWRWGGLGQAGVADLGDGKEGRLGRRQLANPLQGSLLPPKELPRLLREVTGCVATSESALCIRNSTGSAVRENPASTT